MYFPGHLTWFVSFKLSSGFPLHLEQQGLQGLTSADLPISSPSPCPFLTVLQPHWSSLSSLSQLCPASWPSYTWFPLSGMPYLLFYLQPRKASCDHQTKVSSPGLGLYRFHLLTSFTHVSTTLFPYSLAHLLLNRVSPPTHPIPMHIKLHDGEIIFGGVLLLYP